MGRQQRQQRQQLQLRPLLPKLGLLQPLARCVFARSSITSCLAPPGDAAAIRYGEAAIDYAGGIVNRDVKEVAQVDKLRELPRLLRALAHHSGQLTNHSKLGASLGLNHTTTQRYTGIFEQLYLIKHLPAWAGGGLARLTRTPKLHFLDSGLLAALRGVTPTTLAENRTEFGPVLESFVYSELLKQAGWEDGRFEFSHFRDKEQNEVDIVIEDDTRGVVGIEVKAAATVTPKDFKGLRMLAEATGKRFRGGIVLYDGKLTISGGERLWAAPLSSLWQSS